jgi:drug/metabolite transporter (DMT)-like permease
MFRNSGSQAAPVAALLLLSLLWACGVLRADLLPGLVPDLLPRMERQAVPFALLAVVAGLIAVTQQAQWPRALSFRRNAILIGLGLFVAPAGLVSLADGLVPGMARVALFTLVPVFTLVFEPYVGGAFDRQSRSALLAALASIAGALCVFPVEIPASTEAGLALCALILAAACIAAANCKAVVLATQPAEKSTATTAPTAAIAGASAAIAFAAASAITEQPVWKWSTWEPELLWSAVVEAPALLLLFWLMRRMSATRMATRYVIAPLLAILIGAALMRSALAPRTWLGLVLMAGGAAYLLLAPAAEPESTGLSLH